MRSPHRPIGIVLMLVLLVGGPLHTPNAVGAFSGFGQLAKYALVDGAHNDEFGVSVGLSGNGGTMIVGARGRTSGRGAAYIYASGSGQPAQLTPSDAATGDDIGAAVAVSGDGTTALVAAPRKNGSTGAVYVFTHAGGAWNQQAILVASDGMTTDGFGGRVALSADGNTAVIGAHHGFDTPGAAYVFVRVGSTWTQQRKLTASDGAAGDFFGFVTISADGNTVVVGADARNGVVGAAYVFVRGGTVWTQQTILTASDGAPGLALGDSVALNADGTTAVIGGNGASYVFVRSGATWTQQQKLTASDGVAGDAFGYAVGVSAEGGTAIVGAIHRANETGGAYVFVRGGGVWSQTQILTISDRAQGDQFGNAIAVSADAGAAVIGAPGKGTLTGATYRFSQAGSPLPPLKPVGPPTGNTPPAPRPPTQQVGLYLGVPDPIPPTRPPQEIR